VTLVGLGSSAGFFFGLLEAPFLAEDDLLTLSLLGTGGGAMGVSLEDLETG